MSIVLCSLESGLGWRTPSILVWLFSLVGKKIPPKTTKKAREYDLFFRNSPAVMEILFLGNLSTMWHLGNMCFHSFMAFLYVCVCVCAKRRFSLLLRNDSKNRQLRGYLESIWRRRRIKNKNSKSMWYIFFSPYFCSVWGLFSALINRKMMTLNRHLDTGWLWAVLLS